jgi:tellurite resistance protein
MVEAEAHSAETEKARAMTVPKIPLNLFGIPFGLAGLGEAWTTTAGFGYAPEVVGEIILLLSAATWLVVLGAYLLHLMSDRAVMVRDLLDPIAAPFASLAVITPMVVACQGLYPHAGIAGRVLTDVFLALTVVLGGWFTGQWIYGPVDLDKFHPGYFLPTVAGGLIASAAAATVGQQRLAEVMFGLGCVCWIVLGSVILGGIAVRDGDIRRLRRRCGDLAGRRPPARTPLALRSGPLATPAR